MIQEPNFRIFRVLVKGQGERVRDVQLGAAHGPLAEEDADDAAWAGFADTSEMIRHAEQDQRVDHYFL